MSISRVSPTKTRRQDWAWISFGWGLAEATFFFIVPDVLLTRLALRDSLKRAMLAALCALAGALIGGALLWSAAAQYDAAPALLRSFAHLPGINGALIRETGTALYRNGVETILAGGLLGQPFKLFAVHAGAQQVPLAEFLLFSVAARAGRFALSVGVARLAKLALGNWPLPKLLRLHAVLWLCFYAAYFIIMR
jgi:membrane protein YqaA with SNARE-associated domain